MQQAKHLRTLGIIGGIAPESTVDYYRRTIAAYRAARPDGSYPQIFINSIDMHQLLALAGANDLPAMTEYLVHEVAVLARAGAHVALFASNTPHLVFDAVQQRSTIPLVSIVEAACAVARSRGLRRVGLLGTQFTMQSTFYADVFGQHAIAVVPPEPPEQAFVHGKYMAELVQGEFQPETRERIVSIIQTMCQREGLDAVVLAGTELPLLLRTESVGGIPLLDTTAMHVDAAIQYLLA
jgi:aspartate racemase